MLITNFFFLCSRQIRLKIYYIMFALTRQNSLPGDDDDGDDDDDDTSAISTCDVKATHDAVAEICRKQVI